MKNIAIILCTAVIFFSCTKDIKLNNANQEQKAVVNCILSVDSTMELVLYKSNLPLSSLDKFDLIKDAQVEITASNNTETLVFAGGDFIENGEVQGAYFSSQIVTEGKNYALSITGNDHKDLSAEIYIPKSPNILTPEINIKTEESELIFTINDLADEENYYAIELTFDYVSFDSDGIDTIYHDTFRDNAYLYSKKDNDGFIPFEDELSGAKVLFDDAILASGNNTLRLFAYLPISYIDEFNGMYYGSFISNAQITVSSMNKVLYEYEKSVQQQFNTEGDLFSESVQIRGNIKNGLGVFGAQNIKSFPVEL